MNILTLFQKIEMALDLVVPILKKIIDELEGHGKEEA